MTPTPIGLVTMRYPNNDPECGPAYKQRWNGERWECAEHRFPKGSYHCAHCGDLNPTPEADPEAYHHAGQWGGIEVFWVDDPWQVDNHPDDKPKPGWYWWPCQPGCLPDGEANGPFLTSEEAHDDATDDPLGDHWGRNE